MAKSTSKLFQSETPKEIKEDAMNLPEEQETALIDKEAVDTTESTEEVKEAEPEVQDEIQDIDLSVIKKKKFRINGDANKIIELNTSDLNILSRLTTAYDRLQNHMDEVGKLLSGIPDDGATDDEMNRELQAQLDAIDVSMRKEIDYIFDSPISDKCADGGSMYDPFEGAFRFEHIIEAILKLYERNLDSEFRKMKKRVSTKTSKYAKHYHN